MLYIMRHGKTDWNARRKLQGRTDIPLNDEGVVMAVEAGERYADVNFDVCYCSPLVRAVRTAELVLKGRDIPIITDERLIELSFGGYEGMEDALKISGSPISVLFQKPEKYVPDRGAESLEELFSRTGEFIREVVEPQQKLGKDVLIVGHGAMNSSIACQIKGESFEKFWSFGIENCKLMRLL